MAAVSRADQNKGSFLIHFIITTLATIHHIFGIEHYIVIE